MQTYRNVLSIEEKAIIFTLLGIPKTPKYSDADFSFSQLELAYHTFGKEETPKKAILEAMARKMRTSPEFFGVLHCLSDFVTKPEEFDGLVVYVADNINRIEGTREEIIRMENNSYPRISEKFLEKLARNSTIVKDWLDVRVIAVRRNNETFKRMSLERIKELGGQLAELIDAYRDPKYQTDEVLIDAILNAIN